MTPTMIAHRVALRFTADTEIPKGDDTLLTHDQLKVELEDLLGPVTSVTRRPPDGWTAVLGDGRHAHGRVTPSIEWTDIGPVVEPVIEVMGIG